MLSAALSQLRRPRQGASSRQDSAHDSVQLSMIAPMLFCGLSKSDGLKVLDLGAASSATVQLFSSYKCRIDFVDLLTELDSALLEPDADPDALREQMQELLGDNGADTVDVCLFWDALNFLPKRALHIFNECLAARIHRNTRAHGFGVHYEHTKLDWREHGFQSESEIASRPKSGSARAATPHTPATLSSALNCLHVDRAILLRDGRLELLLASPDCDPLAA